MDKSLAIAITICIIFWLVVTAFTFNQNLPLWCANPTGAGNWIVQPLCI